MKKIALTYWLVLGVSVALLAQTPADTMMAASKKELASPSVLGMSKSKGIVFRHERQPNFGITSTSNNATIGNKAGEVRRYNRIDARIFLPVLNNPHLKLVLGLDYAFEEFNFKYQFPPAYAFYNNLQDKNLKTIGSQIAILRPINEKNYFVFRVKGDLNGDYGTRDVAVPDYLRTTVEFIYGWKKSPLLSYGIGGQLGYVLGRRRIVPAFLYNRTFNSNWGLEMILPARAQLRYNASEKSLFYSSISLDGANYNITINNPEFAGYETLQLRRSEVRGRLRWEREIYDFIWFGLETGYRKNIRFDAFPNNAGSRRTTDPVVSNKLKDVALVSVDLFLVPPKRFLKP